MDIELSIIAATRFLREHKINPEIGVVLGTGLGNAFLEEVQVIETIPYNQVPHFPIATVTSHKGQWVYGIMHKKKVLIMQGRIHYYEGYSMNQVTLGIRIMKQLGVEHLLISNAAGNLNPEWHHGELMLLTDHINLQPDNPLRGRNPALTPRFPDMSAPYSIKLNNLLQTIAKKKKIKLHEGVYAAVMGPNLETRAEYKYLRTIGADVVGMSTVPEVLVANQVGLPCCAVSVLTNDAITDKPHQVALEEILEVAAGAEKKLTALFSELIKMIK
ncbi:MAG TPA: purine-nucleoside phosphorylase [Cyclobacteriaceae bacterium]|nr:purine-nucleoside phosphorylase [Cyclobacteriaceae bacterium]HRF32508.1 purine-nucleoside phosphorylase [Cyclobacteriaceae bacterium]